MKVIILAAGMGTRLRPYTEDKPKGLVEIFGKPIVEHQLSLFEKLGISNVAIVTGYKSDKFTFEGVNYYHNKNFDTSNMLYSLMEASNEFDGNEDLLISYGDIIYSEEILRTLMISDGDVVVAADKNWLDLWSLRMEDPLADAESFKYSATDMSLIEIGKPLNQINEAQAQYLGLIKVSKSFQQQWLKFFQQQKTETVRNKYMTDFIQELVDEFSCVNVSITCGGWLEVDSVEDKKIYEEVGFEQLIDAKDSGI